jgi:hypothetical protein
VIIDAKHPSGWQWWTGLIVSCLVVVITGWRLAMATSSAGGGYLPPPPAEAPVTSDGQARSRSAPHSGLDVSTSRSTKQAYGWTTQAAVQAESEEKEPGRPRKLVVPRLGLEMPIKAVTIDPDGAMVLLPRPTEIGWYAYGPRPGAPSGSAVLGGHVDSRQYGVGPLVALERLRRDDDILITTDAGKERFRVITVELISKQGLDVSHVFDRDGAPQLRIITCGGTYRRSQGGYQANVVVTALPR